MFEEEAFEMLRLTVKIFLESLTHKPELPIVYRGATLKEVVGAMVKGYRRRIVYIVDPGDKIMGSITLSDLKDIAFRYYLDGRLSDLMVITEHIEGLFTSERAVDLMDINFPVCHEKERLGDVIARMIQKDLQDMPVLDKEDRVVGNLDMLDLLELWVKRGEELF